MQLHNIRTSPARIQGAEYGFRDMVTGGAEMKQRGAGKQCVFSFVKENQ